MKATARALTCPDGREPALCASTQPCPCSRANASAIWLRQEFSTHTNRMRHGEDISGISLRGLLAILSLDRLSKGQFATLTPSDGVTDYGIRLWNPATMQDTAWDVVVIGAGAAGLLAAARAAERGRRTLLLEKNRKAGVQNPMSGGTPRNPTHPPPNPAIAADLRP